MHHTTRWIASLTLGTLIAACGGRAAPPPSPVRGPGPEASAREADLEARVGRLELELLERDAQVADLQARLDDARQEVVRAMAKLQTLATRAEAASALAEAQITVQGLPSGAGNPGGPAAQARRLLDQSSAAFNQENYGGALYLANQAKSLAATARLATVDPSDVRPGEVLFAVPVPLKATGRGNVRSGPGTTYAVAFTVAAGAALTGESYLGDWVRVADDSGRVGWLFRTIVGRR